jgi:hypothetical protein
LPAPSPDLTYDVALRLDGDDAEEQEVGAVVECQTDGATQVCVGGVPGSRLRIQSAEEYVMLSSPFASLRVDNASCPSSWSDAFSVDEIKAQGSFLLSRQGRGRTCSHVDSAPHQLTAGNRLHAGDGPANMLGDRYCLAVDVEQGPVNWRRTPIVVLRPKLILTNATPSVLVLQAGSGGAARMRVPAGATLPVHCDEFRLRLALDEPGSYDHHSHAEALTAAGWAFSGVCVMDAPCAEAVKVHNKISGG